MPLIVKGSHAEGASAPKRVKTEKRIKESDLTVKEIEFILRQLRQGTFKGTEFELFYSVFLKLSEKLSK